MGIVNCTVKELLDKNKHIATLLAGLDIDVNSERHKKLSTIFTEKHIQPETVIGTIELILEQPEADVEWLLKPVSVLIDHIQVYYHRRHRKQLPELIHMAEELESSQAELTDFPKGIKNLLQSLHADLLSHMEKEERLVFPMINENLAAHVYCQVSNLMHNHDHHFYVLEKIKTLTDNFRPPQGASYQWVVFNEKLAEFKKELLEHIRLENELLFSKSH
jgi:regulator of cell morphogenesis and NO signaling